MLTIDGSSLRIEDVVRVARNGEPVRVGEGVAERMSGSRAVVERINVEGAAVYGVTSGVVPWVPEHGSLGASGDLAPLAHIAAVLLGEGFVRGDDGARVAARDALSARGI